MARAQGLNGTSLYRRFGYRRAFGPARGPRALPSSATERRASMGTQSPASPGAEPNRKCPSGNRGAGSAVSRSPPLCAVSGAAAVNASASTAHGTTTERWCMFDSLFARTPTSQSNRKPWNRSMAGFRPGFAIRFSGVRSGSRPESLSFRHRSAWARPESGRSYRAS